MKLIISSGIALATAAVAFAGDECCTTHTIAASPTAWIENANPPAPGDTVGVLKGGVMFEGEKPKQEPLEIAADKAKGCVAEGEVDKTNRSLLVHKDGGIANVVVMVEVKGAEIKVPEKPLVLDQIQCRFEPHIVCIPTGATVDFKNSDEVSHNVNLVAKKNDSWNKTIPAGGSTTAKYEKTDQIRIKCDIHPWMESWMVVTDTPYMTVTGADGSFSIPDLPPGEHTVEYWHESLGKGKETITVAEDGSVSALEIKMSAEKKKSGGRRRR